MEKQSAAAPLGSCSFFGRPMTIFDHQGGGMRAEEVVLFYIPHFLSMGS